MTALRTESSMPGNCALNCGLAAWHGAFSAEKRLPFAFPSSSAHDEDMGEWCERCGRPGEPCSIHDSIISGKWKTLTLCDQCHRAIRQMDVRACKWFRRYCDPRNRVAAILKINH